MLIGAMSAQADDVMKKEKDGTYVVNTTTLAQDVEGYNGPTPVDNIYNDSFWEIL